jgi:hypothetical protein
MGAPKGIEKYERLLSSARNISGVQLKLMVTLCSNVKESGIGLLHYKTSRKVSRAIRRASVFECGSHAAITKL